MIRAIPREGGGSTLVFTCRSERDDPRARVATDAELARAQEAVRQLESGLAPETARIDIVNACLAMVAREVVDSGLPMAFIASTIAEMIESEALEGDPDAEDAVRMSSLLAKVSELPVHDAIGFIGPICHLDRAGMIAIGHCAHHVAIDRCATSCSCAVCLARHLRKIDGEQPTVPGGN